MHINTDDESAPITLSQVAPEIREIVRKLPRPPVSSRLGRWLIRTAVKLAFRDKKYDGVRLEKHTTPENVRLRVHIPETQITDAALLWVHGGGLVIGSAAQDDAFCAETARDLGIVVVAAEYRLAPDFPFPAALNDCFSAWTWLQGNAQYLHIDPKRVVVGGQSAGGGIAAGLAQQIRDSDETQPIAQWLFCPMLDDRTAASRKPDGVKHFVWDNHRNRTGWSAYLGAEFGAGHVTDYAVPARRTDLSGLPPAWIGVGDIDLFFQEDKTYADRLNAAGVDCAFDIVAGAPHGFETLAPNTKLAQAYLSRARSWLRHKLIVP